MPMRGADCMKEATRDRAEILGEYIVRGGLYGSMANVITRWKNEKKNPVSYLFSRLFLPYEHMKYKYPKLKKYPVKPIAATIFTSFRCSGFSFRRKMSSKNSVGTATA